MSTISLAAETDAKIILNTGTGADVLTSTKSVNFGDSINSGAGNDTIKIYNNHLTSIDTIDGGAGENVLTHIDATTLLDAAFDNVFNIQTITGTADKALNITLGAHAAAAGIMPSTLSMMRMQMKL